MRAALAVDCTEPQTAHLSLSHEREIDDFTDEEIDPLATLIARLDQEMERRDLQLDERFAIVVSRRSSIPLALCGTKSIQPCDEMHAGRCRRDCRPRFREWRAELDAAHSGSDDHDRYELSYRVRWTSDWYYDDLAALTQAASLS